MRISSGGNIYSAHEVKRADNVSANSRASRAQERQDMVELSSHAKDYSKVKRALSSVPDIRADKVEDIKSRINAGTYNVTGMDVANKLFGDI